MIKKITKYLTNSKVLILPRLILVRMIRYIIRQSGYMVIIQYNEPERSKIIDLINKIKGEIDIFQSNNEAYQLYSIVRSTEKIKGDLAEVGVAKGGSAKLICEAKGNRTLHLFDTFEGLPKRGDGCYFKDGEFAVSLEKVKSLLKNYTNVKLYKGIFPTTAEPIKDKKFSFVHLDVDTYKSTLDCLQFFYTRMNKGGMIISHDYICPLTLGVKKAFDEFFIDKPEPIIEMSGSQCLIVKL